MKPEYVQVSSFLGEVYYNMPQNPLLSIRSYIRLHGIVIAVCMYPSVAELPPIGKMGTGSYP